MTSRMSDEWMFSVVLHCTDSRGRCRRLHDGVHGSSRVSRHDVSRGRTKHPFHKMLQFGRLLQQTSLSVLHLDNFRFGWNRWRPNAEI